MQSRHKVVDSWSLEKTDKDLEKLDNMTLKDILILNEDSSAFDTEEQIDFIKRQQQS